MASRWRRAPVSTPARLPGWASSRPQLRRRRHCQHCGPSAADRRARRDPARGADVQARSRVRGGRAPATRWSSRASRRGPCLSAPRLRVDGGIRPSAGGSAGRPPGRPCAARMGLDRAVAERSCRLGPSSAVRDRQVEARRTNSPPVSTSGRRCCAGAAFPTATASRSGPSPRWSSRRPRSTRAMGPRRPSPAGGVAARPRTTPEPIAEAIAQLTGLKETRGVVGEGFWACAGCSRAWRRSARSLPFWTTLTGPRRRFSS